jgi:hypothetical protein
MYFGLLKRSSKQRGQSSPLHPVRRLVFSQAYKSRKVLLLVVQYIQCWRADENVQPMQYISAFSVQGLFRLTLRLISCTSMSGEHWSQNQHYRRNEVRCTCKRSWSFLAFYLVRTSKVDELNLVIFIDYDFDSSACNQSFSRECYILFSGLMSLCKIVFQEGSHKLAGAGDVRDESSMP